MVSFYSFHHHLRRGKKERVIAAVSEGCISPDSELLTHPNQSRISTDAERDVVSNREAHVPTCKEGLLLV